MNNFERFIPISKVDEEKRMVYGFASTPHLDSDGEIITLGAIKNALPEYLQFPTLREMHQSKAAGTVKETEIKSGAEKGLYIGAKVVADDAWNLVKEGVYRGFSIGGHVLNKVDNVIDSLDLVEISLVDVPANKKAKIEVWKAGKLSKDAETVYTLANLMIQVKDTISYYEALEKDKKTIKKLKKVLEILKQVIGSEASEPESNNLFMSDNITDIEKEIESLQRLSFKDNPTAEILRRAVISSMEKKKDELKKEENVEVAQEDQEVADEAPADVETKDSEKVEAEEEVVETEETAEEAEEAEETEETEVEADKTAAVTLEKADEKLEKLSKVEKAEKLDMGKTINAMSSTLAKAVDTLVDLSDRLAVIEKKAAPLKSKSPVVYEVSKNGVKEQVVETNSEAVALKARLTELNGLLNKYGRAEFAKRGLSAEAIELQDKLSALEK